jgi:hypothetical protein
MQIGIYEADHHHFLYDFIDLQKVQDECREHLKGDNYYSRKPASSVIHHHKRNDQCIGYEHEEYRLTAVNADEAATNATPPKGTAP